MKNLAKFSLIMFVVFAINITPSFAQSEFGSFTDPRDGHVYRTAEIGNYVWMSDNLAYKASSGCYALNDADSNVVKYGYLYTFKVAQNVCPQGWHLPTVMEAKSLYDYPYLFWTSFPEPNGYVEHSSFDVGEVSGFELKSNSGSRDADGKYYTEDEYFWTSTGYNNKAYLLIEKASVNKQSALSVRCVKNK